MNKNLDFNSLKNDLGNLLNEQEILNKLRKIEGELSPENLSCDGEADPKWVRARYNQLTKEKNLLIKKLGRNPTFEELNGFTPRSKPSWLN